MEEEINTVNEVLEDLEIKNKHVILCINKSDIADPLDIASLKKDDHMVQISALKKINLDSLLQKITELLPSSRREAKLLIPFDDGKALSMIHENGLVKSEEYTPEGFLLEGQVDIAILNMLEKYILYK